jgi:hypothetical protein
MIRPYLPEDLEAVRRIHVANKLPESCFPNVDDPVMLVKKVVEINGEPIMASFLRGTAELYLVLDHDKGTPEERWHWLQRLTAEMKQRAWELGLNEFTAWVPPGIEKSFQKRLKQLGFERSPWHSYTLVF